MEKNKNVLIGGLLAIVLVMAVGYAAFATQLNITGTATVDSVWDVHFDTSITTGTATPATGVAVTAANTPTAGAITYSQNDHTATIAESNLYQPGDTVTWTLKVKNYGNLAATTEGVSVSVKDGSTGTTGGDATTGYTVTSTNGAITYTVQEVTKKTLQPAGTADNADEATITVTAVYNDVKNAEGQSSNSQDEATGITISVDWAQA